MVSRKGFFDSTDEQSTMKTSQSLLANPKSLKRMQVEKVVRLPRRRLRGNRRKQ